MFFIRLSFFRTAQWFKTGTSAGTLLHWLDHFPTCAGQSWFQPGPWMCHYCIIFASGSSSSCSCGRDRSGTDHECTTELDTMSVDTQISLWPKNTTVKKKRRRRRKKKRETPVKRKLEAAGERAAKPGRRNQASSSHWTEPAPSCRLVSFIKSMFPSLPS